MAKASLGLGFHFIPSDVELVMYYLQRKIMGNQLHVEAIPEIDLCKFEPFDLPGMSCFKSRDLEWFFFCSPSWKYATRQRTNGETCNGYWKCTGKDKPIYYNSRIVGMRKTLVLHIGKAPHGDRTDWIMYEFRLQDKELADANISQDAFVLCKIFKRSGNPKNGEQYGASFNEDFDDDNNDETNDIFVPFPLGVSIVPPSGSGGQNEGLTTSEIESQMEPLSHQSGTPVVSDQHAFLTNHDIDNLLLEIADGENEALITCGYVTDKEFESYLELNDLLCPMDHDESYLELNDVSNPMELNESYVKSNDLLYPLEVDESYLELNDLLHPLELDESYLELNDLLYPLELDESYLELNDRLYPLELDESYLELNDLSHPMEVDGFSGRKLDFLFAHHGKPDLAAPDMMNSSAGWDKFGSTALSHLNAEVGDASAQQ